MALGNTEESIIYNQLGQINRRLTDCKTIYIEFDCENYRPTDCKAVYIEFNWEIRRPTDCKAVYIEFNWEIRRPTDCKTVYSAIHLLEAFFYSFSYYFPGADYHELASESYKTPCWANKKMPCMTIIIHDTIYFLFTCMSTDS